MSKNKTINPASFLIIFLWVLGGFILVILYLGLVTSFSFGASYVTSTPKLPALQIQTAQSTTQPLSISDSGGALMIPTPDAKLLNTYTPPSYPLGKIVYVCQIEKNEQRNQICLMNGDGSGKIQLTNNIFDNFYPSLAPDGNSIVFSSNQTGSYEIYEMNLSSSPVRLTNIGGGGAYAPEISPDGRYIVFSYTIGSIQSIGLMNRNGSNLHELYNGQGNDTPDPTWSPTGTEVLFATGTGNEKHLYIINIDGTGLRAVNQDFTTRGRSDWSPDGRKIASYTGAPWQRKIFWMNADGTELTELVSNGNALAPSFSPDSNSIVFTAYIDQMENPNGCEIYTIQIDKTNLKRLTDNDYCDWQPRWGK